MKLPTTSRHLALLAGTALLGLAALRSFPTRPALAAGSRVEVLKTPNGGIQPQAVVDSQGTLHLVYFKGEPRAGDLLYQRRASGQTEWSAPLRVNSEPASAVAMGTIRDGHLAVGKANRVHVVWFGAAKSSGEHGGGAPLLYTRLNEAGTAFERSETFMQSMDGWFGEQACGFW